MKQKNLYLTCGIPGSGKSTYIKSHFNSNKDIIISRDKIRFKILDQYNETNYFACENLVFKTFIDNIKSAIKNENIENIIVDATHLMQSSREKVLKELDLKLINEIILLNFQVPLETALKRNEMRRGRERVPESAIRHMYYSKTPPLRSERNKWNMQVINIKET